jgi:hypothetical protein
MSDRQELWRLPRKTLIDRIEQLEAALVDQRIEKIERHLRINDALWTADVDAALRELDKKIEQLEGFLLRNHFRPCDIPACNCGSWHHDGTGYAARFREIDEATEDFWMNGETLLDRIKRIAALENKDE